MKQQIVSLFLSLLLIIPLLPKNSMQVTAERFKTVPMVVAGYGFVLGLKSNGMVLVAGIEDLSVKNEIENWTDIVQVVAYGCVVGLKEDGTVVVAGDTGGSLKDTAKWSNIKSLHIMRETVVGVKDDGTVVIAGSLAQYYNDELREWKGIIDAKIGRGIIGLKKDGTIIHTNDYEYARFIGSDFHEWSEIVSLDVSETAVIGLKKFNGIVAAGFLSYNVHKFDDNQWTELVDVCMAYDEFLTGIKRDGSVVVADNVQYMYSPYDFYEARTWTGITQLSSQANILTGLRNDGTVVVSSWQFELQEIVKEWNLLDTPAIPIIIPDLTNDGQVTLIDLFMLTRYIASPKKYPFTDEQKQVADVNSDGIIDATDKFELMKYLCSGVKE
jgi:hypothetical protein